MVVIGRGSNLLVADEGARLLIEGQIEQLRQRLSESACPVVRCSVGDLAGGWQSAHQQHAWRQPPPPPAAWPLPPAPVAFTADTGRSEGLDVVA